MSTSPDRTQVRQPKKDHIGWHPVTLVLILIALLAVLFDHYGIVSMSSQAQFFCVLFAFMGGFALLVGVIAVAIMMDRGAL